MNEEKNKDAGKIKLEVVDKNAIKSEFDNKLERLTRSSAYLNFCEEVYGFKMYLFNMMDKQQLNYIFNSVSISEKDTLLDLGCGYGSVLDGLVTKYGCRGIGIDQLNSEIVQRSSRKFTYVNGDIDNISNYDLKPSITIAIDSLYFSNDLNSLIMYLKSIKNNKLYLFYSQYIFDENSIEKSILEYDKTKLAQIFKKNSINYKFVDFSENERRLYENSIKTLPKYREMFMLEGNTDLYEAKLKEDTYGIKLYDKNLAARYLYIIE